MLIDCQSYCTYSCNRSQRSSSFFHSLRLVEICHPFFGHNMADIIAINHDRCNWHSSRLPDLQRVECIDKRGYSSLLICFRHLNDQLAPPHDRSSGSNQVQPGWTAVPSAMRIMPHVRRTSKTCEPAEGPSGRICVNIHL